MKIMSQKSNERKSDKRNEDIENTIGAGKAEQDANADRGGTTDMDSTIRKTHSTGSGSGVSTKREVSGSDFDGQVMDQ
jgi:hypothetical protein